MKGPAWTFVPVLVALSLAGPALAQDEGVPVRKSVQVARAAPDPAGPDVILTINFPGGTVGDYINQLKAAAGKQPANIVTSRAATEVQIGPISLREVSLYTALSAIATAAGRDTIWSVQTLVSPTTKAIEGYAIEFEQRNKVAQPRLYSPSDVGIQVISLRDITEPIPGDPPGVPLTKPAEVVLTAVRAALDLTDDHAAPPEMKYHEDSGLLIIRGNGDQMGAVTQTLQQMRDDIRRRRDAARLAIQPRVDVGQLKAEIQKAEIMRSQAQSDMERGENTLARVRKLFEAGQAPQEEVDNAAARRDEARTRVELASVDLGRMQEALKSAEAGGGSGGPLEPRLEELRSKLAEVEDKLTQLNAQQQQAKVRGGGAEDPGIFQTRQNYEESRRRLQTQIDEYLKRRAQSAAQEGASQPEGKSTVTYDLPAGSKGQEQLVTAIRALEKAVNDPDRLKVQTADDGKLVVEADGTNQAIVRGMIKEVASGRGSQPEKPKARGR